MDEISSLRNTLADTKMALADQESVMQRYEDDIIELRAGTPSSADNSPGKQMNQSNLSTEFNKAMGGTSPSVRLLPPLSFPLAPISSNASGACSSGASSSFPLILKSI